MAFSVQDFHDLVRLLEQRPEWRAELRRLVLSEELLELPALVRELVEAQRRGEERLTRLETTLAERFSQADERLTRLETTVAELVEAQQRTDERLTRLETTLAERFSQADERLTRLETAVTELVEAQQRTEAAIAALTDAQREISLLLTRTVARLDRLEQHVDDLRGSDFERRYREHAGGYFGRLLRRVRVVGSEELDDLLDEGLAAGTLDEEATHDVRLADLIVRGRHPGDDRETYLVVEVSAGVGPSDVERAARRASLLGRVRPALAAVAGERITPEGLELAAARGVWRVLDGRILGPTEP